ncbi:hypothetical protein IPL85_00550 [Candidatus Saccharibacteria bacterium]|nr:MAG: hypothetical protein IPL85_00550 [Candidatus Saccharibacteria bacterium]
MPGFRDPKTTGDSTTHFTDGGKLGIETRCTPEAFRKAYPIPTVLGFMLRKVHWVPRAIISPEHLHVDDEYNAKLKSVAVDRAHKRGKLGNVLDPFSHGKVVRKESHGLEYQRLRAARIGLVGLAATALLTVATDNVPFIERQSGSIEAIDTSPRAGSSILDGGVIAGTGQEKANAKISFLGGAIVCNSLIPFKLSPDNVAAPANLIAAMSIVSGEAFTSLPAADQTRLLSEAIANKEVNPTQAKPPTATSPFYSPSTCTGKGL